MTIDKNRNKKIIAGVLWAIILFNVLYFALVKIANVFFVTGESMLPTFRDGDIVYGISLAKAKEIKNDLIGEVAIIKVSHLKCIKRIVAGPGDMVEIRDGVLYVNSIAETGYEPMKEAGILADRKLYLQDDMYFCLGDNRNASEDGRVWGCISAEQIKAIVTGSIRGTYISQTLYNK